MAMRNTWMVALVVLVGCGGARAAAGGHDSEGERRVAALRADVRANATVLVAPPPPPAPAVCEALPIEQWTRDALLEIHEASTCRYRVTWLGWSPPRDYDYVPDAEGWIRDYVIQSDNGWVFWNLRTRDVVVRPVEGQPPLDEEGARRVASWARATNFPGLDLGRLTFVPTLGDRPHD